MKCNLCGCEIEGYGNNPAPLIENENDRCCDSCDGNYVIPVRLLLLTTHQQLSPEDSIRVVKGIRLETDYYKKEAQQ